MDICAMRLAVSQAYPGMKWKARVNRMPTNQIFAIYKTLEERKTIKKAADIPQEEVYEQLNIFDYILSRKEK